MCEEIEAKLREKLGLLKESVNKKDPKVKEEKETPTKKEKKDVTSTSWHNLIFMPYEEESKNARRRAIRYLVYRDRSRNEIIRYLNEKKFSADSVDETLIFLESNDYINDERFAMQFGRSRIVNKKIGRLRLGLELGNKGLERKIIEETLNSLYEEYDEKKIAMSCAKKKTCNLFFKQ